MEEVTSGAAVASIAFKAAMLKKGAGIPNLSQDIANLQRGNTRWQRSGAA